MTVGLVLDFAGGTMPQYEDLRDRMQLGGHMPPGGRVHTAGRIGLRPIAGLSARTFACVPVSECEPVSFELGDERSDAL